MASSLPEKILVLRKNIEGIVEEDFFVRIEYEKIPKFYREYKTIGHNIDNC